MFCSEYICSIIQLDKSCNYKFILANRQGKRYNLNQFKKQMMSFHMQEKNCLNRLYIDKQIYLSSVRSSEQPVEEEKIYVYKDLSFQFMGTGFRTPQKLILLVFLPEHLISGTYPIVSYPVAYEDYVLGILADSVNHLSEEYQNDKKSAREKAQFFLQPVSSVVQRRNGCIYLEEKKAFRLRIQFQVPLLNGICVNGKAGFKAVKEVLNLIANGLLLIEKEALDAHVRLYSQQLEIRQYLKEHNITAFIANGSILPREGDTQKPAGHAVPFVSPPELEVSVPLQTGEVLTGMGVKKGITVITGGGYSGKSTLLDSIEQGIYHHRRGDGREYVITDDTACKIYAEDGRYICDTDISPFFSYISENQRVEAFSSLKASGSVSQAVNIIEAVYGGSRLLLIDEDTSAANFMLRDENMRKLVQNEPIIPFTDRIVELKKKGISTILVIGGSSEYLKYADTIILMDNYIPIEKTQYVRSCLCEAFDKDREKQSCQWTQERYLQMPARENEFFYSEYVQIENARYIKINDYIADITKITAIICDGQINSLAYLTEKLLTDTGEEEIDLLERCRKKIEGLIENTRDTTLSNTHQYELCLEMIRPLDLLMAVSRMRGLQYRKIDTEEETCKEKN